MSIISAGGAVVGAGGPTQYEIERSLRFNSADSAYLNRTPGTASNRKTFTWSGWNKPSKLDNNGYFFSADDGSGGAETYIEMSSGNQLNVAKWTGSAYDMQVRTSQVFRDPSAWYHIVVAVDTTQATASNRVKIYVNGSLVTAFANNSYPTQNSDLGINNTTAHAIGRSQENAGRYYDGYMTEIHFIDGQALDETDFGEFSPTTGVWGPIAYTGTYGTNGFFLNFSDNSGVTSTTLGKDQVGSNNWTPNGFSVTAGAGNDSLVDTCTLFGTDTGIGGEVRGNYATINAVDKNSQIALANGNLDYTNSSSNANTQARATIAYPSTGKWYFESTRGGGGSSFAAGIGTSTTSLGTQNAGIIMYNEAGQIYVDGVLNSTPGTTFASSDTMGVAVDMDAAKVYWYKNGVVINASGFSFTVGSNTWMPMIGLYSNGDTGTLNFGQRAFAHTAPSGFKALVTTNLPDPTVIEGDEYFNTVLYTGTGASNARTGVGFQPDWVWIKERNAAADHGLYDAVRGVQNQLESNTTTAETAEATGLTAFGADGFTVGALAQLNTSGDTYVAWNWKANGAGVSNTAGTISSTVSANTDAGFSIVTYTGTGAAATVGHGLGAVLGMYIVKNRDAADAWQVYHAANTANPETDYLVLNTAAATADAADRWNDTLPTSTLFSIGNGVEVNTNTEKYVAYCFAAIPGYSAFGSYTGNGSADGPFVFTGFRPAFVMVKRSDSASDVGWFLFDTARGSSSGGNVVGFQIYPNLSNSESSSGTDLDILSNGFKMRGTFQDYNASGGTYIYMAFAESPFKYSLAR